MSGWGANDSGWGGGDAAASAWGPNDTANGDGSTWNNGFAAINGRDNYGTENTQVGVSGADSGDGNPGNDRACFNCGEPG